MSEITYDLESFKKEINFFCDIEYTSELEARMNKLLYTVKTWVLSYCNRVQRTDKETGELIFDEFINELKPIALQEAVRRFLLDLINKGQFKPHGGGSEEEESTGEIQSVKIGDTTVTSGTGTKRSSKEITESFQKQLTDELKEIKLELNNYRHMFRYGDIYESI